MSKLIIVAGLPATGKTTLSTAMSKELGIVCLHKDTIKEQLYDILGLTTLDDSREIGKVSFELMKRLIEECLENEVDVIVDCPFNHSEDVELLQTWEEKYAIDLCSIICEIDEEERVRRFNVRSRHESHHDVDRLLEKNEHDADAWAACDYRMFPGKRMFLETDRSIVDLVAEVKDFVESKE